VEIPRFSRGGVGCCACGRVSVWIIWGFVTWLLGRFGVSSDRCTLWGSCGLLFSANGVLVEVRSHAVS
jgi:hypothetical protein